MATIPVTRRLAAIVIADVVGYTRLMERDDAGTFSRLRAIRDEVVDPAIVSHDGRIVKTAGDGLLAEFPSALAALRASVRIQCEMAKRNAAIPAADRIDYRIGVNLGDIMVDGNDIAGDGVNVASRLESLAEPAGICVSGSVMEQVHGQMPVRFVDIGAQRVKNIERPIRVYRVVIDATAKVPISRARFFTGTRRTWATTATLLVAALTITGLLIAYRAPPSSVSAPPMSIALLPLRLAVDGVDAPALSQRLTKDAITALARGKRSAFVAPYAMVSSYAADDDPRSVGRALNVRYVAEADVRISNSHAKLTTRLYDAATAAQLSSDSTDVGESDAGTRDDLLVARAVGQIRIALLGAERNRARSAAGESASDQIARAGAVLSAGEYSLGARREALRIVDEVLKRDPNSVAALVRRFWLLNAEYEEDLHADRDRIVREMDQATSRAVALDSRDPEAWWARSTTFAWQGRWAEAEAALAEARRLDPTNSDYVEQRSFVLMLTGRFNEVNGVVDEVLRMVGSPSATSWPEDLLRDTCWANLDPARYAAAIPACEKTAAMSTWWTDDMHLAAVYAQTGQIEKAKVAAARLLKQKPDLTIDLVRRRRYSDHPEYRRWEEDELFAGLRKAGVPEN